MWGGWSVCTEGGTPQICVSPLHRGHADLLHVVPILVYMQPKRAPLVSLNACLSLAHTKFFWHFFLPSHTTTTSSCSLSLSHAISLPGRAKCYLHTCRGVFRLNLVLTLEIPVTQWEVPILFVLDKEADLPIRNISPHIPIFVICCFILSIC